MAGCLSDDTILRFVQGRLSPSEADEVESHLGQCATCRRVVADTAKYAFEESGLPPPPGEAAIPATDRPPAEGGTPGPEAPFAMLAPGTTVARYQVIDIVGIGGAGMVYRAFDPQLARHVALKVILPELAAASSVDLIAEAQAMARLSHPNVVGVYDAGTIGGQVFVIMELVEGTTLTSWLKEKPHDWRDILHVFVEAGRGLCAAHAASMVHGDFKPDNVLIGTDGRARVTDFGLATMGTGISGVADGKKPEGVSGTPIYMAPEQFVGKDADALSDQFTYCVALWKAICGQHPFVADDADKQTLRLLVAAMMAGRIQQAPPATKVPAWLYALLARGLSRNPLDRYPALGDLLAAVEAGLARETIGWRSRRKQIAAAGGALAAIVLVAGIARWWAAPPAAVCGNGAMEPGEDCDDGNRTDTDGCLGSCRFATCGDGKLRAGVEECDDGNLADGDGCTKTCVRCDAKGGLPVAAENGSCFSRYDVPMGWAEASAACKMAGAHLITKTIFNQNTAVRDLIGRSEVPYWIGIDGKFSGPNRTWFTGEPLAPFALTALSENPLAPGQCVGFSGDFGHWHVLPCAQKTSFVCEKNSWLLHPTTNHAYVAYYRETSWETSRKLCERFSSHLAAITSAAEQTFLGARLFGDYWVGGIKAQADGGFSWITGEPLPHDRFGEDDPNFLGAPACVALASDHKLRDRACDGSQDGPYGVLCEID